LFFAICGEYSPGAGVGQEWNNLVENTLTADSPVGGDPAVPASAAAQNAAAMRDSPVFLPSHASGKHVGFDGALTTGAGSGAGPGEEGDGRGVSQLPTAPPRWQNSDVRIDVLRELEDIATMTISETAFFCK
jgi:hypothetical protein